MCCNVRCSPSMTLPIPRRSRPGSSVSSTAPCDDLVLMTGEGLRRLMKVARRIGAEQDFIAAHRQGAQIRPRPEARPGAARDRTGAAGDDGEADLGRHHRDAVAASIWGTSRRPAALPRQGSQRADRRDHRARRRGRSRAALCLRCASRRRQHRHRDRRDGERRHRRHRADEFGAGSPPDRGRTGAWLRSAPARGAGANADRLGRTGGFGRVEKRTACAPTSRPPTTPTS